MHLSPKLRFETRGEDLRYAFLKVPITPTNRGNRVSKTLFVPNREIGNERKRSKTVQLA